MILEYILGEFGLERSMISFRPFLLQLYQRPGGKGTDQRGKEGYSEMIDDGKPIEVNCHFCNKNYVFDVEELKELWSWPDHSLCE